LRRLLLRQQDLGMPLDDAADRLRRQGHDRAEIRHRPMQPLLTAALAAQGRCTCVPAQNGSASTAIF